MIISTAVLNTFSGIQQENTIQMTNQIKSSFKLFSGIQQENRHIRQLQHENKELRAALEEHQVSRIKLFKST
jgi:hypothetical protein